MSADNTLDTSQATQLAINTRELKLLSLKAKEEEESVEQQDLVIDAI